MTLTDVAGFLVAGGVTAGLSIMIPFLAVSDAKIESPRGRDKNGPLCPQLTEWSVVGGVGSPASQVLHAPLPHLLDERAERVPERGEVVLDAGRNFGIDRALD